ncbi:MAG: serine hydrolase domain-containing protein [Chloroflexota bacterium]
MTLEQALDALAEETSFSGVVRVDGPEALAKAYGLADRAHEIPNETDMQFATASGTKALTALTVVSLVEAGLLELATPARAWLGDDLPLIGEDVTIEHLLAHTSGIGDYLDEETEIDIADYPMPVPVHELAATEEYVPALDGHPPKFEPGERFAYSNSGYVVLALVAERASGTPFHDLVRERVCGPAGMPDTAFLRSDALPGRAAIGYLEIDGEWRSNVFHLPVRGSGDGGIYTTAADIAAFWPAFLGGRIVSLDWVREMVRARTEQYGLGFWLRPPTALVSFHGCDAGVSFRTVHDPDAGATHTVLSNTTDGAFPLSSLLDERLTS